MELNRKSVEMTNVEWSEIMMKGIVKQSIIDGEIMWWFSFVRDD